jgi:glc operon protein GlcG
MHLRRDFGGDCKKGKPMMLRAALACAVLVSLAGAASAQMVIERKVVSSEAAKKMGEACEAHAAAKGWKVSVWVIDEAGQSLYMHRMQGAPWLSVEPSRMKAQTALQTGRPSSAYEQRARERGEYAGVTMALMLDNFMASGGVPVVIDGQVAGAIGVGGGPPGGDEECAKAGIAAVFKELPVSARE